MVQEIRPAGAPAPVPASRPAPGPGESGFPERLREAALPVSAAAPGAAPADPVLAQVQRFAAQVLGTEAWEARLLESYDMLSADEALYEVQTSKGPYQVIRSRMGGLTAFPAP